MLSSRIRFVLPALAAALKQKRAANPRAELEAVARELYEMIFQSRRAITMIERSALDLNAYANQPIPGLSAA